MSHKIDVKDLEKVWFTADQHFGHENIIKFCDRPFQSVEEMDDVLIDNWNKVIGKDDIVYHLGDFTLGNFDFAKKYFAKLNGKIQVLANHWHHDKRWLPKDFFGPMVSEYPDFVREIGHVDIVPPMIVLEIANMGEEGRPLAVTLCHYPLAVWDRRHYGSWHLHGHTHKHNFDRQLSLNVGVDCMNFSPISLGGVLQHMYKMGW
jgi:calcineurin-like phosphoesterase family protein